MDTSGKRGPTRGNLFTNPREEFWITRMQNHRVLIGVDTIDCDQPILEEMEANFATWPEENGPADSAV